MLELREIQQILKSNPGDPVFVEYAEQLRKENKLDEALQVCFRGLNSNPSCHAGRLLLARVFYQQGHLAFAIREISELVRSSKEISSLRKLLYALSPELGQLVAQEASVEGPKEDTIAEAEFEFEALDEIKANKPGRT